MHNKMKNKLRLILIQDLTTADSLDSFILDLNYRLKEAGYSGIEEVVLKVMSDE